MPLIMGPEGLILEPFDAFLVSSIWIGGPRLQINIITE